MNTLYISPSVIAVNSRVAYRSSEQRVFPFYFIFYASVTWKHFQVYIQIISCPFPHT